MSFSDEQIAQLRELCTAELIATKHNFQPGDDDVIQLDQIAKLERLIDLLDDEVYEFAKSIDPALAKIARDFCHGTDNKEYVRGQAELLIDMHVDLTFDDRDALMRWLVR